MRQEMSRVSTPDQRRFRADTGRVLDLEARVKKAPTREAFKIMSLMRVLNGEYDNP